MEKLLIVIGLVACAVALLCVRIILCKDGRFSSQHISQNRLMRRRGIHCAVSQDREARGETKKHLDVNKL